MKIGVIVFIAALALALISGVLDAFSIFPAQNLQFIMLVLGILAGYLNITKEEKMEFLTAGIAFIISLQVVLQISKVLATISPELFTFIAVTLTSIMVFSAGALAYVAIKSVLDLIRD